MIRAGDSRKVFVLAVIAVAVLSVAVVRSIPVGDIASQVIASIQESRESSTVDRTELPKVVLTNPFFHPKLVGKNAAQPDTQAPPGGGASEPGSLAPVAGQLPSVPLGPLVVQPEEVPGSSQQSKSEPKKLLIVLEAVLKARTSLAMVSIDGGSAEPRRVGDLVAAGVRIVSISQDEVVLSTSKGKRKLAVGRRLEL